MSDQLRREFLRRWAATVGIVALPGCGGGSGTTDTSSGPVGVPPPGPAPTPAPAPGTDGSGSTALPLQFTLLSATTQAQAPFSLGFAFPRGSVPAGSSVSASLAGVQTVIKNRWPDGSAKFGVVSGIAALTANTALPVTLTTNTLAAPAPAALSLAQLKATQADVLVEAGSFGQAAWSNGDWDAPFASWVSGPQMSSWIYRKPIGSDAHLVAWLEVRLYANGALEILPWIENGYLGVASPSSRSATFSFTLGGKRRFSRDIDLPHHCRTPLLDGQILSHWLGDDPGVVARQNAQLLQATELVPSYLAKVAAADLSQRLPASFVPLQQGSYASVMGQTGYHPAIGLLPEWDVGFLVSDDGTSAYRAMLRNAYSAGRYPIHYRDEATQRPLRFSAYPNLSLNSSSKMQFPPQAGGTAAPTWDIPHHPSVGYMAYLATGSWYFMEQIQFAATRNYLWQVDNLRGFSKGIFLSSSGAATVRGAAWAVRTLAQAAAITPDDDPLHAEFLASLAANIEFNHATYVAQANNPFGIVAPYGDTYGSPTDGKVTDAPWQQDFYTAAYGYALAMQPGVGTESLSKLSAFFAWKARSVIGRLGGTASTEWLYRDAALYNFVVATVDQPDWLGGTGPWASDWGVLYQATLGQPNPGQNGSLRGGNFPGGTSYWGNLLPAIAYAVRHAVPGAAQAYARLTGADNWAQLTSTFNKEPVWGVSAVVTTPGQSTTPPVVVVPPSPAPSPTPSSPPPAPPPPATQTPGSPAEAPTPPVVAQPAWLRDAAVWQWLPITGTALSSVEPSIRPLGNSGSPSKIETWCGATLKRKGSVYMLGAAGGHADYGGNEVDALDLLADRPAWEQWRAPTANADIVNAAQFYLDNRPAATHTYYATQFIDRLNRMVVFASGGLNGPFPAAPLAYPYTGTSRSASFDVTRRDWDAPDYIAQYPGTGDPTACLCVRHPLTGDVYYARNSGDGLYRWLSAANRWDRLGNLPRSNWYAGAAIDTVRNRMLLVGRYDPSPPMVLGLDGSTQPVSFGGLGADALTLSGYPGVVYDELNDLFIVAFNGSAAIEILTVRASDLYVAKPDLGGVQPSKRPNGIQNSLQYVPQLKGVVIANSYRGDVYFMRTS